MLSYKSSDTVSPNSKFKLTHCWAGLGMAGLQRKVRIFVCPPKTSVTLAD